MSKSSKNSEILTKFLGLYNLNKYSDKTKSKLNLEIDKIIKQAQNRCIGRIYAKKLNSEYLKKIQNNDHLLADDVKKIMENELENLLTSKEFSDKCKQIIIENEKVKSPSKNFISINKNQIRSKSLSKDKDNNLDAGKIFKTKSNENLKTKEKTYMIVVDKKKKSIDLDQSGSNDLNQKNKPLLFHSNPKVNVKTTITLHSDIENRKMSSNGKKANLYSEKKSIEDRIRKSVEIWGSELTSDVNKKEIKIDSLENKIEYRRVSKEFFGTNEIRLGQIINDSGESSKNLIKTESQNSKEMKKDEIPNISYEFTQIPLSIYQQLRSPLIQKFQKIRDLVEHAIRNHKIFNVNGYSYVRKHLYARNWIEKIYTTKQSPEIQQLAEKMSLPELVNLLDDEQNGLFYNRILKSKIIGTNPCDFYWNPNIFTYNLIKNIQKPVYLNHFRKRGDWDFCSKIGLQRHLRQLFWFYVENVSDAKYPRTFILSDDEMSEFVNDFRLTACISILKWVIKCSDTNQLVVSKDGKVPLSIFYFALLNCYEFICSKTDVEWRNNYEFPIKVWDKFMDYYYNLIFSNDHFKDNGEIQMKDLTKHATNVLKRARKYRQELDYDGIFNIWILKPDQHSRGNGITICRRLCNIKEIVSRNYQWKYIIQKYIERPLLIYNTKFDIRQWFLVTALPLTFWMYKECYLRFSSQQYNLKKFHEAVHLTNNSVQCKYKNSQRDCELPNDNMWDLATFKSYLEKTGEPEKWEEIIYPRMKQSILSILCSAKHNMEMRNYTFELFGADFMITPDFQPWLIEINSHPALQPSTSVTARLCPKVLEDVLKVVLDYSKNPGASTGKFEQVWQDIPERLPNVSEDEFFLVGQSLKLDYYRTIDENIRELKRNQATNSNENVLKNLQSKINDFVESEGGIQAEQAYINDISSNYLKIDSTELIEVGETIEKTKKIVELRATLQSLNNNINKQEHKPGFNLIEYKKAAKNIKETIQKLANNKINSQDLTGLINLDALNMISKKQI